MWNTQGRWKKKVQIEANKLQFILKKGQIGEMIPVGQISLDYHPLSLDPSQSSRKITEIPIIRAKLVVSENDLQKKN